MPPEERTSTSTRSIGSARPARVYFRLLNWIHCLLLPRTYLEIGVAEGKSLALTLPCTRAIGIDPEPRIRYAIDPGAAVEAMTSDAFFTEHQPGDVFGGLPVDVAFIDGLHLSEFVLRDFMNIERFASPDSLIVLHDVLPGSAEAASRSYRAAGEWTGDVWKVIPALREYRPDLSIRVVDVSPTGLALLTGLDPASTRLARSYDQVVERMNSLSYNALRADPTGVLDIIEDDWATVAATLPRPFQKGDIRALRRQRALRLPPRRGQILGDARRRLGLTPLGPPLRKLQALLRSRRGDVSRSA